MGKTTTCVVMLPEVCLKNALRLGWYSNERCFLQQLRLVPSETVVRRNINVLGIRSPPGNQVGDYF